MICKIYNVEGLLYNESSRTGLVWANDRANGAVPAGSSAGSLLDSGYYTLSPRGYVHRLIWQLLNGPIPEGMEIDHINGNRSDNRIQNLRLVTRTVNCHNIGKTYRNTSGAVGVILVTCNKSNRQWWRAYWTNQQHKVEVKSFRTDIYDDAFELACSYREKMIAELNSQGARYTPRHGQ